MALLGIISLFLDLIILNFSKYIFNNISFLFPMLTLVYIISIFYFCKKITFSSYLVIFLYLLTGNSVFIPLIILILIFILIVKYKGAVKENILSYLFAIILSIILFDTFYFLILVFFNYLNFNISFLFYKIINSIILNALYGILLYYIVPVLISSNK